MSDPSLAGQPGPRIATLDYIRGIAVMGILVANLPGFALPEAGYFSPAAWGGERPADLVAWALTFILVEGKFRGLFSVLFGASMLLVLDRARAAGDDPVRTHLARMTWLFIFGIAHMYLIWWGDILAHYALVGVAALLFVTLSPRWLVFIGTMLIGWHAIDCARLALTAFASAPRVTPQQVAAWTSLSSAYGIPAAAILQAEIDAMRGGYFTAFAWRADHAINPVSGVLFGGGETLGYMLLGMAALRSGFLTGGWQRRSYAVCAGVGLAVTLPAYTALAWLMYRHQFAMPWVVLSSLAATVPVRPLMIFAYAAALILAFRPAGRLSERIAATGRAAFTNYLGTSLAMTAIFYGWGLGQFARVDRAALYLLVPPAWAIMLLWSTPWLARYRYGPLEWLWRSLARLSWQPMRRTDHIALETNSQ